MASVTASIEANGPERPFFAILRWGYGYRALLYLLLSPAVAYLYLFFFWQIMWFSQGTFPLFAPILLLAFAWPLSLVERGLAQALLGMRLTPMARPLPTGATVWDHFKAHLLNPVTWKSLVYLASRILFGLFAFALTAALLTIALACLFAPLTYLATLAVDWYAVGTFLQTHGYFGDFAIWYSQQVVPSVGYSVQALGFTFLLIPVGVVLCAVVLHVFYGVGAGWGWYARNMLGINPKDIELAQARAATVAARARADEAEKDRRQLILDASHELRTPVATIRAHIDSVLILQGEQLPEQVRAYLATTQHEIERLSLLVDDLLMLARADSDGLQLTVQPVDAGAVIEEVFQALEPLAAHERQVTLVRQIADNLPRALADRERLAQVILNLARNAITYTPAGGIVSLDATLGDEPDTLTIAVTDTGIGIAEDDLPCVFERFYRTDASRARHSGGFGLGLSITRDLIQAMGGSVRAESIPAGGSRFTVTLPTVREIPE
ncbi:MAG TPA: ATP-binding protein [Ktedonobacterales bacterium]|jgi:signal transduction histidine kinase